MLIDPAIRKVIVDLRIAPKAPRVFSLNMRLLLMFQKLLKAFRETLREWIGSRLGMFTLVVV